jgi:hypothetical protein
MRIKGNLTKALMFAVALFVMLPVVTNAQGRRWGNKCDVFVNCHDASDGRVDGRGPRRDRRDRRTNDGYYRRDARDVDGDGDYDQRDVYIIQQRQRNGGYYGNNGSYGTYGNNGRYTRRGYGYGGTGYYSQSQQTALNAGYNEGIKEGRRDRSRGGYRNVNDYSAYRNADKDYNSRYGDRYEYQRYFRAGFENGYNDGLNGY